MRYHEIPGIWLWVGKNAKKFCSSKKSPIACWLHCICSPPKFGLRWVCNCHFGSAFPPFLPPKLFLFRVRSRVDTLASALRKNQLNFLNKTRALRKNQKRVSVPARDAIKTLHWIRRATSERKIFVDPSFHKNKRTITVLYHNIQNLIPFYFLVV